MSVINSKIGIIGGGVSGLAAVKHLSKHNPMVFEATDSIGGVWKHCSFRTTKLQTPRSGYQFSDFPWPPSNNDDNPSSFPTYVEILDYLDSYANHFDLIKFINFNSKVTEIRFVGDQETMAYQSIMTGRPLWEVAVHNDKTNIIQVQNETAVDAVVDAHSPVVADNSDYGVDISSLVAHLPEGVVINLPQIEVEEPAVEVDTGRSTLRRFLNMTQFGMFLKIWVAVVTQMHASSETQKIISLGLLAAIMAVYAMKHWAMTRNVIISEIALNFAKLLCFYLLPCILKPEWLSWYGIVIVCIIATAYTFSDELKNKFIWCYEKNVQDIKNVMNKVFCPKCNDQASPVSGTHGVSV